MKKDLFLTKSLIAHRGFHDIKKGVPENSMLAFRKAIRNNYIIELDVHLTKDGELVVFHDDNLKRICGVDKIIEECTYKELLKLNLSKTKYKIPLFSDVLKLVDGKVGLLIETKVLKCDGKLEEKLSELLDNYNGEFAVQSFNPMSLYWFKKNRKNYLRGLLSGDFSNYKKFGYLKRKLLTNLTSDLILKTDFISYDISALPYKVVTKKRKKKLVLGWTVRNKTNYKKAVKYCDNLICENMNDYEN